jgi:hypothetical protein
MRVARAMFVCPPAVGTIGLLGASVVMGTEAAGAQSSEPPPVVVRGPHSALLRVGGSHTFAAVAEYASDGLWQVSADNGSTWSTYSGTNKILKDGNLKSKYRFGPFTASDSGWELRAVFVNDPCGTPSCIQETATSWAAITEKGT